MKKFTSFLVAFLTTSAFAFSQTDTVAVVSPWKITGVTGINFSQTSLVNWSAGGSNAIAGNVYLNGDLSYAKDKWLWENHLGLDYGLSKIQNEGVRKTADKIEIASKLGYKASKNWYYTGLFDFRTQFTKGYNYPNTQNYISTFLAPAFSTLSLGAEYKPNDKFYFYYSPVAAKFTIVNDDYLSNSGAFGVEPGKKFKAQAGSYVKTGYKADILENVSLTTSLNLFTAYDKSFGNIDVNWDTIINMKINKFMNAMLSTSLIYDDDIKYVDKDGGKHGARVQFKEVLGVGIAYKF